MRLLACGEIFCSSRVRKERSSRTTYSHVRPKKGHSRPKRELARPADWVDWAAWSGDASTESTVVAGAGVGSSASDGAPPSDGVWSIPCFSLRFLFRFDPPSASASTVVAGAGVVSSASDGAPPSSFRTSVSWGGSGTESTVVAGAAAGTSGGASAWLAPDSGRASADGFLPGFSGLRAKGGMLVISICPSCCDSLFLHGPYRNVPQRGCLTYLCGLVPWCDLGDAPAFGVVRAAAPLLFFLNLGMGVKGASCDHNFF